MGYTLAIRVPLTDTLMSTVEFSILNLELALLVRLAAVPFDKVEVSSLGWFAIIIAVRAGAYSKQ